MRVDVYNKYHIAEIDPTPGTVVISIGSPGESYELKPGWDDVLRIEFDDVVKIPTGLRGHGIIACSVEHADIMHEFIERHIEQDFLIHCGAGWSRSVAVGAFMRDVHGADLHLHEIHSDEKANSRVRRALMDKYWRKQFSKED